MQTIAGGFDPSTAVAGPEDAQRLVLDRRSEGADYIKIIIEDPAQVGALSLSVETIAGSVVAALRAAQLPIIAASDADNTEFVPFSPRQGESLHDELELLVAAGLSPAELFGLTDRGQIEPGLRTDLLLVDGYPTTDIRSTRDISRVWVAGVPAR